MTQTKEKWTSSLTLFLYRGARKLGVGLYNWPRRTICIIQVFNGHPGRMKMRVDEGVIGDDAHITPLFNSLF